MKRKSRLVVNESPAIQKNQYSHITFNLQTNKASLRHDTMEGRDFLVAPCVMITEGVHAGSQGPLYYPAEELSKTPAIWNSKPVVVYHPQANGQSISACDPVVFSQQKIGVLLNTRFEEGKLKTECWLEEDRMRSVDERVLTALEGGDVMEVSTGLFTDNDASSGEWNGEAYSAIARNYRPDHLAILPDQKGACSVDDGAGLLRNAAGDQGAKGLLAKSLMSVYNELSHNEIWSKLNAKIRPTSNEVSDTWVTDVFDGHFIYEKDSKTYFQKYSVKDDEVKLNGIRMEAEKITSYKLSDGSIVGNTVLGDGKKGTGQVMDKEQIVNQLISNAKSPWSEDDREMLMGLSEEKLGNIVTANKEKVPEPKAPAAVVPPPVPAVAPTDNVSKELEITVEQYISNAPSGMQDVLRSGLQSHARDKAQLVGKITANSRNPFTEEQLNVKSLDELRGIAQLAEVPQTQPTGNQPHYVGMGEATPIGNQGVEEPLIAPVMSFDKE